MKRKFPTITANICSLAALALVALPAAAQSTSSSRLSAADQAFMKKAAQSDIGEIAAGSLAQQNAASDTVRMLGKRYADDHRTNLQQLTALAQQYSVSLPSQPSPEDQREMQRLGSLNGSAFDTAFVRAEQRDHFKSIAAFKRETRNGSAPAVVAFAKSSLPVLDEHLQIATDDAGKLRTANSNGMNSMGSMNSGSGSMNSGSGSMNSGSGSMNSGSGSMNSGSGNATNGGPYTTGSPGPRSGASAGTNTASGSDLNGNTGPVHLPRTPASNTGTNTGPNGSSGNTGSSSGNSSSSSSATNSGTSAGGNANATPNPNTGATAGTNTATGSNLNGNTGPVPLPTNAAASPSPSPSPRQ